MWEGRDPHIFPCPGSWIAQFLGVTSGVGRCNDHEILHSWVPSFSIGCPESGTVVGTGWESFGTGSDDLVCYPNMPSIAVRR
jgi:hypothetical protein